LIEIELLACDEQLFSEGEVGYRYSGLLGRVVEAELAELAESAKAMLMILLPQLR
jgi:hypothetical protein